MNQYLFFLTATLTADMLVLANLFRWRPALGASGRIEHAAVIGAAIGLVSFLACVAASLLDRLVVVPLGVSELRPVIFVGVVAIATQFGAIATGRMNPPLDRAFGRLPQMLGVSGLALAAVVGVVATSAGFVESLIKAFAAGTGYALMFVLLAGVRERIEAADVPAAFRGISVALLTAGLASLGFMGLAGLFRP
ncbi:MAG: Rnf-Nqr domain containing protein [Methylotetracoccus sp.]